MTADIEMLPLPKKAQLANPYASRGIPTYGHSDETLTDYARAVAEHNVSRALAESDHSLRAANAGLAMALEQAEARAERLAEALRRQRDWWLASKGEAVSNAPGGLTRIDPGFIALCDAHVQQIDLALRDHDQENSRE